MTRVVIAPSYGSTASKEHWKTTLAEPIRFTERLRAAALTRPQREALLRHHPRGEARFWGARSAHDKRMAEVGSGDVVLFTGGNHVRAVGEIGHIFRNADFADVLWPPETPTGSWRTVYSLTGFERVHIPYPPLCRAMGYAESLTFPGQILATEEQGKRVLDLFGIEPASTQVVVEFDENLHRHTSPQSPAARLMPVERSGAHRVSYTQPAKLRVAELKERLLLAEYQEFLGLDLPKRYRCAAGVTDLHVDHAQGPEIVEAKSSAGHKWVRQALSQLLDYAPHSLHPVWLLTALFPERPLANEVTFLHRYGVDCVYRTVEGSFTRLPADETVRSLMRERWSAVIDGPIASAGR
ncbi:hypothetical protein [Streptomyces sp. SID3343]|uniref:hypothetical protein n=1 Tax=Streptomyces sp. SID3343 TaxID=2690260 RepID=UPI00136BF3B2|nr:hypothetical protein [Streptomyces sp. SID3343]MYV99548.1 hypothetical protein [Streptomyces sp. SID3343]